MNESNEIHEQDMQNAIAVVGMAGRFPGARNLDEFWQNLRQGVESITTFTNEDALASGADPAFFDDPNFVKAFGFLDDIELFDAAFFNMSPREAKLLDPQHRFFLEVAWAALENAGYDSERYKGRIGVFAGANMSTYLIRNLLPNKIFVFLTADRFEMALSNNKDVMPMRVSYQMNLTGPSVNISTTCSTSLVAVQMACQSLLTYQCDMMLAGGAHIRVPQKEGYLFQEGMIWSPDGHVRTFDAEARGIVTGNGVGVVVLKRLEDALQDGDTISALILGSAINNDGSTKIGYTAPSIEGQAAAAVEALSLAGVHADTLSYIEVHGTGTELGDPVEHASMSKAFRTMAADPNQQKKGFCALGSVKTNIGHLNHAAGVAGLLKTVLALKHKIIPASLNFRTPNPNINFADSPFYVNTTSQPWEANGTPRRAGINSFGVGGTNAHAVLQEAPVMEPSGDGRPWQLIALSAKTPTALETATANLADHLQQHPELPLADAAYTLHIGRRAFDQRRMLVVQDSATAINALRGADTNQVLSNTTAPGAHSVVFMFSGQGAQYVNMTRGLYQNEPTFQQTIDRCAELLQPDLGLDLRDLLYPAPEQSEQAAQQLDQTFITQSALFVVEYALAQLWISWGVQPKVLVGHSIGEYVAACLAGVFSLEDALALVAARGRMMQALPLGDMLAISLSADEVQALLTEEVALSVINTSTACVVGGTSEAIAALQQQLTERNIEYRRLRTSHAFHSPMMQPIVAAFAARVAQVTLHPPQIPYLSNLSGTWITEAEATDPSYWAKHLRQTVRFVDNVDILIADPTQVLLEVGPGRTLSTFAQQHPAKAAEQVVLSSVRHPQEDRDDEAFLLTTLGRLWLAGVTVDWAAFYSHERRQRCPLPTYPFERKRYWIDTPRFDATSNATSPNRYALLNGLDSEDALEADLHSAPSNGSHGNLLSRTPAHTPLEQQIADIWQKFFGLPHIGIHDNFFDLGGSSFMAGQLVVALRARLQIDLPLPTFLSVPTIAELARQLESHAFAMSSGNEAQVESL